MARRDSRRRELKGTGRADRESGQDKFPRKIFITVLAVTSLLLILPARISWLSYKGWRDTASRAVRLQELAGTIRTADEILTMSARMAAATGDLSREGRYLGTEPTLDGAIAEALQLLPDNVMHEALSRTDKANRALVKVEKEAFDLIRMNRGEEAAGLLFSGEYLNQKRFYADGTADALEFMDSHIKISLKSNQGREFLSFLTASAVFALSLISWIFVLRLTQRYVAQRDRKEEERIRTQGIESVGTLAGGIAHDFNNLLQGIFGYIALARQEKDNP